MLLELITNTNDFILQALPGFLGVISHKFFQGQQIYFETKKDILKYFTYTLFTISSITLLTDFFAFNTRLLVLLLSTVIPIILSILWIIMSPFLVIGINFVNKLTNRNTIFIEDSTFEKNFKDGKDHFLVIHKNNKILSYGFLADWEENNGELTLSLVPPEIDEKYVNRGFEKSLIFSKSDIYIEEIKVEKIK